MKERILSYRIDNAQDLFEALANFTTKQRQAMQVEDYDCLDVVEETLSDRSKVLNLKGRWFPAAQRRRENGSPA